MKSPQINIQKRETLISLLGLFIILGSTILLYKSVPDFGWITGLDQELLIENRLVYYFNSSNVTDMFFSATAGRYEPLTFLSYSIDIGMGGEDAIRTIHLMNLILHLLNIIILFRLVKLMSNKVMPALIASLIFALHPLNLDAVAWLSARNTLLCAFFFLSALLSYVYYLKQAKTAYRNISVIFFLLALLSNIMAVLYPFALIVLDQIEGKELKKSASEKVFLFILSLVFLIIALLSAEGQQDIEVAYPLLSFAPGLFLLKYFVPLGISGLHQLPFQHGIWQAASLTYIPFMGLAALTGWAFCYYYKLSRKSRYFHVLIAMGFAVWMVWIAWTSVQRLPDWKSSASYWNRVIELYPEDFQAYFYRGDHWAMNADFEKAKFDYTRSIMLNDNSYKAMNNLGLIYLQEKALRLALAEFSNSIRVNEDFYKAHLNRGLTYMRIGKNELAMENMDRAIELNPDEPLAYYNRGLIFERANLLDQAIEDFSRAIRLDPYKYVFYKDRGKAFVWTQRFQEAELDFSRALELDPSDPEMWFRRSLARVSQNKFEAGLEDAIIAQSLGFPVTEDYIKGLTVQILELDSIRIE